MKRLIRAAGGCIFVPADVDLNRMSVDKYEETVTEHKPLQEMLLMRYARETVREDDVDGVSRYLEES